MRFTAWMRLTGSILFRGTGRWPARSVLAPLRRPSTHGLLSSGTPACVATICRGSTVNRRAATLQLAEEAEPNVETTTKTATRRSAAGNGNAKATPARAARCQSRNMPVAKSPAEQDTSSGPTSSPRSQQPLQQTAPRPHAHPGLLPSTQHAAAPLAATPEPTAPTRRVRGARRAASAPNMDSPALETSTATAAAAAAAPAARVQTLVQSQADASTRRTGPAGTLLIVDGNYLANRAYFGYGTGRLFTSSGVPTSITYSVLKTLHAAIRAVQPTALAVVFDPPGPTFRSALSLLDPSGAGGATAARLVQEGRLDWQDLATRLLSLAPIQSDLLAAAEAEAAATPQSFLHTSGSFLDPAAAAAAMAAPEAPRLPAAERHAEAVREVLVAALGPDLAGELGLLAAEVEAGAEAGAGGMVLPSYKAGRTPHAEDFLRDFRNLQRLLGLMSIPPLCWPWLEADDLAGLLVQQAVRQGMSVRVLTGDRDLMQLVSDPHDVALLYPSRLAAKNSSAASASATSSTSTSTSSSVSGKSTRSRKAAKSSVGDQDIPAAAAGPVAAAGSAAAAAAAPRAPPPPPSPPRRSATKDFPFDEYREAEVESALGVVPGLVAEFKALTGDDSDKLPGITGIGPKTAVQLLSKYGTLAAIRHAAAELTPKRRASLQADWPAAQYTLALARVLGSAGAPPLPAGVFRDGLLQRLELRGYDPRLVQPALLELEINSLARQGGPGGELWRDFGGAKMPSPRGRYPVR